MGPRTQGHWLQASSLAVSRSWRGQLWSTMVHHGPPWSTMVHHGPTLIPLASQRRYQQPCPPLSEMAIISSVVRVSPFTHACCGTNGGSPGDLGASIQPIRRLASASSSWAEGLTRFREGSKWIQMAVLIISSPPNYSPPYMAAVRPPSKPLTNHKAARSTSRIQRQRLSDLGGGACGPRQCQVSHNLQFCCGKTTNHVLICSRFCR